MLIEFSVANFRSIKEWQTLSMVASNRDKSLPGHLIDPQVPGLSKTKLLKSAAIYGANASGKSNVFKAAQFMRDYVVNSAVDLKPGDETGVVPFRLDSQTEKEPSEFEMIFIHDGIRYQYGFILDKKKVYEEWLTAYPSGLPQRWYSRAWNDESSEYDWKFSSYLKGEKESFKEKTRDNALFLSVAAQWNHEQLNIIFEYYRDYSVIVDCASNFPNPAFFAHVMEQMGTDRDKFTLLIKAADLGITGYDFYRLTKDDIVALESDDPQLIDSLKKEISEKKVYDIRLLHKCVENGKVKLFDYDDESEGTWKYISVLSLFLVCLSQGCTLFLDEIGAKMHPLLIQNLLTFFCHPKWPKNAQLIFTTHDTTQLNQETLRRDQIWFTEKNEGGETILYPLTDFKPRQDESLQKGYLAGRYGAIPFLGDFTF